MGPAPADVGKIPDFSVLDNVPELHTTKRDSIVIKANYQLIIDNLLDLSHTSYLHEGILGNADTVESEITAEQDGNDVVVGRHATNSIPPGMFAPFWPNHPPRVDKFTKMRLWRHRRCGCSPASARWAPSRRPAPAITRCTC
jgi:vanillate O-demethylase monooxygenase subunit